LKVDKVDRIALAPYTLTTKLTVSATKLTVSATKSTLKLWGCHVKSSIISSLLQTVKGSLIQLRLYMYNMVISVQNFA